MLTLYSISQNKLTAVLKHYKQNGMVPHLKRPGGRHTSNKRYLKHEDILRVVNFLNNFAEANALVLPGRVPGFTRFDIKLLPSHETKASVWRKYKNVGLSFFFSF